MALKPFTMSNGIHVKQGDWITTPFAPMLQDPKNWTDPHNFHRFRHADVTILASLEKPDSFKSPDPDKTALLTDIRG